MKYRVDLPYFSLNGKILPIEEFPTVVANKSGLVYELVKIIDSKVLYLKEHIVRLNYSLRIAGYIDVLDVLLSKFIDEVIVSNNVKIGNLKIVIEPYNSQNNIYLYFIPHRYPTEKQINGGVKTLLQFDIRNKPTAKIANWKIRNKANRIIDAHNVFETVLVDNNNEITEGSRTNIFFIKGATIITAESKSVLHGITRQIVIDIILELNLKLIYKKVSVDMIETYDACFLTGTSIDMLQVSKIDDYQLQLNNPLFVEILSVVKNRIY